MSKQTDNNLPASVTDDHPVFTAEDLGEKECTECHGTGKTPEDFTQIEDEEQNIIWLKCEVCKGEGTVPKTEDDYHEEREMKSEPDDL